MQKTDKEMANVQTAALIDLKAELFRKQEEFKAQKLQNQSSGFVKGKVSAVTKKPSLFSKKNAGVSQRADKDHEEKVEEENVFEKSRKALENKAKLYEKISTASSIPEEDGSGLYLVDFQKKVIDNVSERREQERRKKEERERLEIEEEQRQLLQPVPPPASVEEEWVDYIDTFGRSRRCLRKDLPDLQKQDKKLQHGTSDHASTDTPSLLSSDMRRELERQKWEQDELKQMEEEKVGPIHYSNVQHNEIRTHGVGYYKFNQEEDVRQQQMEQLNQLRKQTKDERSKIEKIKEKRKAALAARLAKVKQRKRERLGLPETPEEETVDSDEGIGPKVSEQVKVEPEPLTRDDSWRTETLSEREWDKGKQYSMEKSEEAWLEKQRAERDKEFAPPSFYYDNAPNKSLSERKVKKAKLFDKNDDTVGIDAIIGKQLQDIRHNEETTNEISTGAELNNTHSDLKYKTEPKEQHLDNTLAVNLGIIPPSQYHSNMVAVSKGTNNFSGDSNLFAAQNTSCVNVDTSVPPPNLVNPAVSDIPLPNSHPAAGFATPLNHQLQPPSLNLPSQDFSIPPPNFTFPPPNVNIPPPSAANVPLWNTNAPPPNAYAPQTEINAPPPVSNLNYTVPSVSDGINQGYDVEARQKKTVIPKEDIIDTRLMESCD